MTRCTLLISALLLTACAPGKAPVWGDEDRAGRGFPGAPAHGVAPYPQKPDVPEPPGCPEGGCNPHWPPNHPDCRGAGCNPQ